MVAFFRGSPVDSFTTWPWSVHVSSLGASGGFGAMVCCASRVEAGSKSTIQKRRISSVRGFLLSRRRFRRNQLELRGLVAALVNGHGFAPVFEWLQKLRVFVLAPLNLLPSK